MRQASILMIVFTLLAGTAFPQVISGTLDGVYASTSPSYAPVAFGDGTNNLYVVWIILDEDTARFYGTHIPAGANGNVDVYSVADMTDPTTVDNGDMLQYTDGMWSTNEGSTAFFRGTNGYYGAWAITDIVDDRLYGTWYFVTDGTGDFTGTLVANTETTWGDIKGLFGD